MPFSPKIIRNNRFNGEESTSLTLKLRHNFPVSGEEPQEENTANSGPQIIKEAEVRAREILDQARQEAQETGKEIAEGARREGYQQGYRQALEEAKAEAAEIRRRAREVLRQAEEQRAATIAGLEKEIVQLAVEVAEKIVAHQLSVDPETVIAIAAEAINPVKERERITIYHHPSDLAVLEQYRNDLQALFPSGTTLSYISDDAIDPGGCTVETEHGRVEATLDSRWQTVLEHLGLREAQNGGGN